MVTMPSDRTTAKSRHANENEPPHPMPRLAAAVRISLFAYIGAIVAVVVLRGLDTALGG